MTTKTLLVYRKQNKKGNWVKRYSLTENSALGELTDEKAYRLIAYAGKILTDGTSTCYVIDTEEPDRWQEIDEPEPDPPTQEDNNND